MSAPALPAGVRAVNRIGAAARALGVPLLRLDERSLLERAAKNVGHENFGDSRFHQGLQRLTAALEQEAALTTLGRWIARSDIVRLLENRARIAETLERHPEIEERPVRRPIFILGLPRTGTTILHELLAEDPDNRVPMTWEVMHPWPPPERATFTTDPRIAMVEKHFGGVDRLLPEFKKMHPMGAVLPQECVALTAHDFASMVFSTTHRIPSYQAWLDATDLRPVYASHRRQLQYLQWRCPAERWVLKSPGHLWALDTLLTVYPDALIIQTHRDPLKVVASLASLVTVLRGMASDDVDPHVIGAEWAPRLADGLERSMVARDRAALGEDRVFDMQFGEFIRDEIGMVRQIYAHFDIQLGEEAETRMRHLLAANPKDKHGAHRSRLSDAGLDPQVERRRFARYQERFGVASEVID